MKLAQLQARRLTAEYHLAGNSHLFELTLAPVAMIKMSCLQQILRPTTLLGNVRRIATE